MAIRPTPTQVPSLTPDEEIPLDDGRGGGVGLTNGGGGGERGRGGGGAIKRQEEEKKKGWMRQGEDPSGGGKRNTNLESGENETHTFHCNSKHFSYIQR